VTGQFAPLGECNWCDKRRRYQGAQAAAYRNRKAGKAARPKRDRRPPPGGGYPPNGARASSSLKIDADAEIALSLYERAKGGLRIPAA
jgi:hypothetical protein